MLRKIYETSKAIRKGTTSTHMFEGKGALPGAHELGARGLHRILTLGLSSRVALAKFLRLQRPLFLISKPGISPGPALRGACK